MSSKDRHYWSQLRLALTSGQWSAKYPARAIDGTALSWSELLRKFNKHCKGFEDVAQVASWTQGLALLIGAGEGEGDDGDDGGGGGNDEYPVELGRECMLSEERIEEGKVGYGALMSLNSSNFDSLNFALAYYAYALGNPAQCLAHLSGVPELLSVPNHIPTVSDAAQTRAHTHTTNTGTTTTTGHLGLHVPSFSTATSSFSSAGGSFASLSDSASPEIKDGRAWSMTETLRSLCLQGMSHEKLSPNEPRTALKSYSAALHLFEALGSGTVFADPSSSAANTKIFLQQRELWRWVERLLWRAIVLSASIVDSGLLEPHEDVWTWLRQYVVCSIYWPATFRTAHRSTVSVLYLRATILLHHPIHASSTSTTPSSRPITPTTSGSGEKAWLHTARTVVNDYRAILGVCTTFPRAGERNVRVEDFVDLCVGVWEAAGASGEGAGWVIDILWWATRLTFNSHRVLRHMTRVLHVAGDTTLARRTLLLYAQVVGKAYETNHANTLSPLSSKNSSTRDLGAEEETDSSGADLDYDSDRAWVETLVMGARILCRWAAAQPGLEGLKEVREAGMCIEKARTRLRADDGVGLTASVDLAEGVWNYIMALKEQDPHTRPGRLAAAHTLFLQACSPTSEPEDFTPNPAALYHLSLSFAHPGPSHDLEQAILHAGRAVEADPREIRYWHLLGLLLAAAEKWTEAKAILESGAAIGEDEGEDGEGVDVDGEKVEGGIMLQVPGTVPEPERTVVEKDFVETRTPVNGNESNSPASPDTPLANGHVNGNGSLPTTLYRIPLIAGNHIPSAAAILAPPQDHPPPSKEDIFEHALQLRMTQGVLSEVIEGAEGAELKWLEVFSWVAAQRPTTAPQPTPRPSVDGGRPSAEPAPSFVVAAPTDESTSSYSPPTQVTSIPDLNENQEALQPIPITISPATPDNEKQPSLTQGKRHNHLMKRSSSIERDTSKSIDRDTSKSKKMQQMFKNRVHQGRARVSTISRKIGNGVVKTGSLKRSNSTPDFHAILRQTSYQASSIHSRRRISSFLNNPNDRTPTQSPPPPPVPIPPQPSPQERKRNSRTAHRNKLLSDLWLMSAATFRRLDKIEQAKGAIQEAEVKDEGNPGVWVQLGLYYIAHGQQEHAMDAYQKALFINPDNVSASVHLARLFLSQHDTQTELSSSTASSANVDLAAGMLGHLTRGNGWNVPEAWYYLAKAYGLQGRKQRERECLDYALTLSASRGIREVGEAVGWCI